MMDPARPSVALGTTGASASCSSPPFVSASKRTVLDRCSGRVCSEGCCDLPWEAGAANAEDSPLSTSSTVGFLVKLDAFGACNPGDPALLLEEAMGGGFFRTTVAAGGQLLNESRAARRLRGSSGTSSSNSDKSTKRGLTCSLRSWRSSTGGWCADILMLFTARFDPRPTNVRIMDERPLSMFRGPC